MKCTLPLLVAGGLAAATLATPAHAAGTLTVASTSCGAITVTNSTAAAADLTLDSGYANEAPAHGTFTATGLPSGRYTWQAIRGDGAPDVFGLVTVTGCAGLAPRPAAGDFDGDRLADVVGVQAGTGSLYAYHGAAGGLRTLGQTGTGWADTVWMQRVTDWGGSGRSTKLLTVRSDGTLWSWDDLGHGRMAGGQLLGDDLQGYRDFAVIGTNNRISLGANILVAASGDRLTGWIFAGDGLIETPLEAGWGQVTRAVALHDMDGDGYADLVTIRNDGSMWVQTTMSGAVALTAPRRIGSGWNAMQTVTSPGSLDGDALSDLVARRSDGNLYRYTSAGSHWAAYAKIGQHWQSVRLLA